MSRLICEFFISLIKVTAIEWLWAARADFPSNHAAVLWGYCSQTNGGRLWTTVWDGERSWVGVLLFFSRWCEYARIHLARVNSDSAAASRCLRLF